MLKWTPAVLALATSSALAVEEVRSNVTATTFEIYAAVGLVIVVGIAYLAWHQKREKNRSREPRKGPQPS